MTTTLGVSRLRHPVLALAILVTLWPTAVLGQTVRAGVVTALEGNVSARRISLPDPIPLRFKDDILLNDRITTGDRSLARVLLGGKATVTIRERSTLAITEVPGRSTVDLTTGKIALAVARERLRPGDAVEIRTPNAIAAIRGTVVIAEVVQATAQHGRPVGGTVTNFYVLRGRIEARLLDPSTRAPVGQSVAVGMREGFSATGAAPPSVTPIHEDRIAEITSGLRASGPQHEPVAGEAKTGALEQTSALLNALVGSGEGGDARLATAPPSIASLDTSMITPKVERAPIQALTGTHSTSGENKGDGAPGVIVNPNPSPPSNPNPSPPFDPNPVPLPRSPGGPEIEVIGQNLTLADGMTLKTYEGTTVRTFPSVVIRVGTSTISQLGPDNLVEVLAGATASLASPLLDVQESNVFAGLNLLDVAGNLVNLTTAPLLFFGPRIITAEQHLVHVAGTLTLSGGLVSANGSSVLIDERLIDRDGDGLDDVSAGAVVAVDGGGTLNSAGTAPLLQFSNATVKAPRGFVLVDESGSLVLRSSLLIASDGSLLSVTNGDGFMIAGDGTLTLLDGTLLTLTTGSTLELANGWLVRVDGGELTKQSGTAPGLIVVDGLGTEVSLSGAGLLGVANGGTVRVVGDILRMTRGAELTGSGRSFVDVAGGTLEVSGRLIDVAGAGTRLAWGGRLLTMSGDSAIELALGLVRAASGGQVTVGGTDAVASIGGGTAAIATAPGAAIFDLAGTATAPETVAGRNLTLATDQPLKGEAGGLPTLVDVSGGAAVETNQLLKLSAALLEAGAPLARVHAGASLESASPLVALSEHARLVAMAPGAGVVDLDAGSLAVRNGSLFSVDGGSLLRVSMGHLVSLANDSRLVVDGAMLVVTGGSLVQLANGSLAVAGSGSTMHVHGAVLDVALGARLVSASTGPLLFLNGGHHSFATADGASMFHAVGRYPGREHAGGYGHDHGHGGGHGHGYRWSHGHGSGPVHEYDEPIRHAGVLLEMAGATVTARKVFKVLKLDSALFRASAPIIHARGGSHLAVESDALDLSLRAKVTSHGPVMRLDASTLAIASGSLINLSGGSVMKVAGDLLKLSNGSRLSLANGPVIRVSSGSVLDVSGALASFGGRGGNRINVTNNVCSGACQMFHGIPVHFRNGATPENVLIGPNPLKNPGLGSLKYGPGDAAIILDGPKSRVTIGGTLLQ